MLEGRSHKSGGGRKPTRETQPGILEALENLVSTYQRWFDEHVALDKQKSEKPGERPHWKRVQSLLPCYWGNVEDAGIWPAGRKKTLTTTPSHADRNKQFEYINKQCQTAAGKGFPVLSIDAKKGENRKFQKQRQNISGARQPHWSAEPWLPNPWTWQSHASWCI